MLDTRRPSRRSSRTATRSCSSTAIDELEPGVSRRRRARRARTSMFWVPGHFPDYAVMPGVLIVEALAQVGAVALLSLAENQGKLAFFAGIDKVRFKRQVVPGRDAAARVSRSPKRAGRSASARRRRTVERRARLLGRADVCDTIDAGFRARDRRRRHGCAARRDRSTNRESTWRLEQNACATAAPSSASSASATSVCRSRVEMAQGRAPGHRLRRLRREGRPTSTPGESYIPDVPTEELADARRGGPARGDDGLLARRASATPSRSACRRRSTR